MKLKYNNKFLNFWEGNSSLEEEIQLKYTTHFSEEEQVEAVYFQYLKQEKEVPISLENEIWKAIEIHKINNHRHLLLWISAASIALIVCISAFFVHQQHQQNNEMQFALIEQTLEHVSSELTAAPAQVIYEDQLIVVIAEN